MIIKTEIWSFESFNNSSNFNNTDKFLEGLTMKSKQKE